MVIQNSLTHSQTNTNKVTWSLTNGSTIVLPARTNSLSHTHALTHTHLSNVHTLITKTHPQRISQSCRKSAQFEVRTESIVYGLLDSQETITFVSSPDANSIDLQYI